MSSIVNPVSGSRAGVIPPASAPNEGGFLDKLKQLTPEAIFGEGWSEIGEELRNGFESFVDQAKNRISHDIEELVTAGKQRIDEISSIVLSMLGDLKEGGEAGLSLDISFGGLGIKLSFQYKPASVEPDRIVDELVSLVNKKEPRVIVACEDTDGSYGYEECTEGKPLGSPDRPEGRLENYLPGGGLAEEEVAEENAKLLHILKELGIENIDQKNFIVEFSGRLQCVDMGAHSGQMSIRVGELCAEHTVEFSDEEQRHIEHARMMFREYEARIELQTLDCDQGMSVHPKAAEAAIDADRVRAELERAPEEMTQNSLDAQPGPASEVEVPKVLEAPSV